MPTIDTIRVAHRAHQKWWSGVPLSQEEHNAMLACQRVDVMDIVLKALDAATAVKP